MALVTLRFSSSSLSEGAPGASTYRLQSLSVIIPRTSVFLDWQGPLSQLLSLIRSFTGQAVFSPQLILQSTLHDGSCRIDICVSFWPSLLQLCFFPSHSHSQGCCFHCWHLSWSTLEHTEPGSPTQFQVLYEEVSGSLLDIAWLSQWVSTLEHFFHSANFCLSKKTLWFPVFGHWSRPHELLLLFCCLF